ncbi:MAG: aerotolerance protein BatA [bacterium]|nr:MAG: aerotolerance protein BatA [bacterium]
MKFAHPYLLLLLLLLPVWVIYYFRPRSNAVSGVRFSSLKVINGISASMKVRFRHAPFYIRVFAVALLVAAIARPQTGHGHQEVKRRGIDIMLAIDTSTSMDIMDLAPTRLEAAKRAMEKFIGNRRNDRIGLVVFAGTSFTRCPLTVDYDVLKSFITPLKSGIVEDGTAIGMAIANGVSRLKDSKAKSKIIILLTDGINNRGLIDPETATELAITEKVKVYTIGVGRPGVFYQDVVDPVYGKRRVAVKSKIDEALLKDIARKTGALYYAARDGQQLSEIYEEIDRLEKSEITSRVYYEYTERFGPLAWLVLILLSAEFMLTKLFLRALP